MSQVQTALSEPILDSSTGNVIKEESLNLLVSGGDIKSAKHKTYTTRTHGIKREQTRQFPIQKPLPRGFASEN